MRFRTPISTVAVVLAALLLLPATAGASSRQLAVFQDDRLLVESGDGSRNATLDEIRALGADVIKVQLSWSEVAPRGRTKPAGFDGRDPNAYPGWGRYDAVLAAAEARGFQVMFALSPPFPGWATRGTRRDEAGVNRPSATEFGRFAEAAGRRYPGVEIWTLANEPNHPGFLYPQAKGGVPVAPHIYRDMVRAAVAGLERSGSGGDTILFGELLPIGKSGTGPRRNLKPIRFLREFFCLDSAYRPFRGRAARLRGCRRYRRLAGLDGFAYHPYTRPGGPGIVEPSADDATIRSIGRVTRALDIARAKRRIGGGRLGVWNTEFGFQSNPPDRFFGASIRRIPHFWALSELWLSQRNRRVRSISWYTMNDTAGSSSLWQGGLRFADGRPKAKVYAGYRLPILVRQLGPGAVEVRGAARPAGGGATVQVQVRSGSGYRNLGRPITVRNPRGYFSARFPLPNAARRTLRFVAGTDASLAVRPVLLSG